MNDLSSGQYYFNQNISFKTSTLRSDSSEYRDAYIAVKRKISVAGTNIANKRTKSKMSKETFHLNHAYPSIPKEYPT